MSNKFRIKANDTLLAIGAPADFGSRLGDLPEGVSISSRAKNYDQVHWFVKTRAEMEKGLAEFMKKFHEGVTCWIYFPKGTSKIQTDLTRDKGWEKLFRHKELKWLTLVSLDDTWSAFAMRRETNSDRAREARPVNREILNWADPATKTIRIPPELEAALKKDKTLYEYFLSLAFSHKREYVEWIVTAKKETTRNDRIAGTLERLKKGWKNPRNL